MLYGMILENWIFVSVCTYTFSYVKSKWLYNQQQLFNV